MMSQQVLKLSRPQVIRRPRVASDSAFCGYSHRTCMQIRLEGHDYCAKHILEDKNTTHKQCNYVSNKTAKRCTNAALKSDKKEGYCADHARRANQARHRISKKRKAVETPETLLDELEHYTSRNHGNGSDNKKGRPSENLATRIMEYGSSTDSDGEGMTVDQTWRGDGESDGESVDSEQEDPLKHAGVYTAEEVALITRDKLIRLQSLYIDQFKRLQHVMKEKRRRYIHTVRKEREALGSINYAKDDPEQRQKYEELVAMKRYHRRFGQEALLHRQSKERRIAVSEGPNYRPPSYPKCILSKNGGKCGARTVPLSKYCVEHVMHDPHQVLFKPCGFGSACLRPITGLFDESACLYHCQADDIEYRLPLKKEEKDESRDEIDVVGGHDSQSEEQSLQLQQQLLQKQLDTGGPGPAGDTTVTKMDTGTPTTKGPPADQSQTPIHQGSAPPPQISPSQVPSVVDDLLAQESTNSQSDEKSRSPTHKKKPHDQITQGFTSMSQIPTTVEEKGPEIEELSNKETETESEGKPQEPEKPSMVNTDHADDKTV